MKEIEKVSFDSMPQLISGSFLTKEQVDNLKEPFKGVVSVVRCKDCKWFHQAFESEGRCLKHDNDYHEPNWFCADGEHKEGR